MDTSVLFVRTKLRIAQGDVDGALRDSARGLELSRAVKDPQALHPALTMHAWALLESDRSSEAGAVLDELLAAKPSLGDVYIHELGLVMWRAGRGEEYVEAAKQAAPSVWLEAGVATAAGRFEDAARIYAEMGALGDEALVRLAVAEAAAAEGRRDEAERQSRLALEFFRGAGATEYVRRGEELLASSA
jgi:hypothetical protein